MKPKAELLRKMLLQRRKGIQTDQIAKGRKPRRLFWTELLMKLAAYLIVLVEIISIISNHPLLPVPFRVFGLLLTVLGTALFTVSVYTMKDSWRAGIPETDCTEFVTAGIYGWSRNPAFLGFDFTYIGLLLMFFEPPLLVCTCFAVIMLHLQVLQEEKFLRTVFGKEYDVYQSRVGRYWGRSGQADVKNEK